MEEKLTRFRQSKHAQNAPSVVQRISSLKRYLFADRLEDKKGEVDDVDDEYMEEKTADLTRQRNVGEPVTTKNNNAKNIAGSTDGGALASEGGAFSYTAATLMALWILGLCALAYHQIAGPFLILTAIVALIYFGTSSGKTRKKTELSAYSVFNPNCVRLEGTFTAEQFENELLRRPLDSGKRNS